MSKKKSLGSSPIGYSSLGRDSFEFIPTINKREESNSGYSSTVEPAKIFNENNSPAYYSKSPDNDEVIEKRIVSYYLEERLVERLKTVADERKMYYSTLVSQAIYLWLESRSCD